MPWSLTWVRALSCLSCLSCLTMQRKTLDLQKQEMVVWFFTLSTWAIWKGRIEGILWRTSEANDCTSEAGGSAAGVCWNCMVGDLETGWHWSGQKHMIYLKQGRNQAAVQLVYSINLCKCTMWQLPLPFTGSTQHFWLVECICRFCPVRDGTEHVQGCYCS